MRYYAQLAQEQRYQIYSFLKAGFKQSQIAREIGVHKSTISRELKRNKGLRGYRPVQAHKLTQQRRQAAVSRKISDDDWQLVESLIRFDLSPEQAAARLRDERGISISPEWIYRYIYADKAGGGDLHRHLRCQKPYRKRYGSGNYSGMVTVPADAAIGTYTVGLPHDRRTEAICFTYTVVASVQTDAYTPAIAAQGETPSVLPSTGLMLLVPAAGLASAAAGAAMFRRRRQLSTISRRHS
ncbi:MAG: helix-turn-helix domain-containing protein [Thermoleophilia bacterium]